MVYYISCKMSQMILRGCTLRKYRLDYQAMLINFDNNMLFINMDAQNNPIKKCVHKQEHVY